MPVAKLIGQASNLLVHRHHYFWNRIQVRYRLPRVDSFRLSERTFPLAADHVRRRIGVHARAEHFRDRRSPHPEPFLRAGSRSAWYIQMTASQLRAAVATARRCPPGVPYSGPPLIAFIARRPVPAGQPDAFIIVRARSLASFRAKRDAVKHVCPLGVTTLLTLAFGVRDSGGWCSSSHRGRHGARC